MFFRLFQSTLMTIKFHDQYDKKDLANYSIPASVLIKLSHEKYHVLCFYWEFTEFGNGDALLCSNNVAELKELSYNRLSLYYLQLFQTL